MRGLVEFVKGFPVFELVKHLGVVAHDEQRGLVLTAGAADEFKRFSGVAGVEIAGGFVSKNNLGMIGQGSGNGDALLLSGRQLARVVMDAVLESDPSQDVMGKGLVSAATEGHSEQHVLQAGVALQEIEGLEDVADGFGAEPVAAALAKGTDVLAVDHYGAGVGFEDARDEVQECGLAGSAFAAECDLRFGIEREAVDVDDSLTLSVGSDVGLAQLFDFQNGHRCVDDPKTCGIRRLVNVRLPRESDIAFRRLARKPALRPGASVVFRNSGCNVYAVEVQLVLDIDLDFFLDRILYAKEEPVRRLRADECGVDDSEVALAYLRERCGLSVSHPVPGHVCTRHKDVWFHWRRMLRRGVLKEPFEVVHVDAHADMGLGNNSCLYIVEELLAEPVDRRRPPVKGGEWAVGDCNFIAYALATRWIGKLTYVTHLKWEDDVQWLHMKDFSTTSGIVQMKRFEPGFAEQLDHFLDVKNLPFEAEPEIPMTVVPRKEFQIDRQPDFVFISQSPNYTPPTADALFEEMKRFVAPL